MARTKPDPPEFAEYRKQRARALTVKRSGRYATFDPLSAIDRDIIRSIRRAFEQARIQEGVDRATYLESLARADDLCILKAYRDHLANKS